MISFDKNRTFYMCIFAVAAYNQATTVRWCAKLKPTRPCSQQSLAEVPVKFLLIRRIRLHPFFLNKSSCLSKIWTVCTKTFPRFMTSLKISFNGLKVAWSRTSITNLLHCDQNEGVFKQRKPSCLVLQGFNILDLALTLPSKYLPNI